MKRYLLLIVWLTLLFTHSAWTSNATPLAANHLETRNLPRLNLDTLNPETPNPEKINSPTGSPPTISLLTQKPITEVLFIRSERVTDTDYISFGHVFKPGEVSKLDQVYIKVNNQLLSSQLDKKAFHPDGSLRHGIISVKLPFDDQQQLPATLISSPTYIPSQQPTPHPKNLVSDFKVALTIDNLDVTIPITEVISQGQLLRRWLAGPMVMEWHYSYPITVNGQPHPHLKAYFQLRVYQQFKKVVIGVTLENNWSYQSNPQKSNYHVTFLDKDKVLFNQSINHSQQARWHKKVILVGGEDTHLVYNPNYLMNTQALPLYDPALLIDDVFIKRLYKTYQNNHQLMKSGLAEPIMWSPGGRRDIGPLPGWAVAYLISQDKRAKVATHNTAYLSGSWPIHYRDKNTGLPLRIDNWPYAGLLGIPSDFINPNTGISEAFPLCKSCNSPLQPDSAHQPALTYLSYLTTGDYFLLEELQFWSTYNLLNNNPHYRRLKQGIFRNNQVRAEAWSLRTLAQTTYITPDDHPLKAYFTQLLKNNLTYLYNLYVAKQEADRDSQKIIKQLGFIPAELIDRFGIRTGYYALAYKGRTAISTWMDDFHTWSIGYLKELGFNQASVVLDQRSKFSIQRMLNPKYCWIFAALANGLRVMDKVNTNDPTLIYQNYQTIGEAFLKTTDIDLSQTACDSADMIPLAKIFNTEVEKQTEALKPGQMIGYSYSPIGYPANLQIALAVAADSTTQGGLSAWEKFDRRSIKPNYNTAPQFALVPRSQYTPTDDVTLHLSGHFNVAIPDSALITKLPPDAGGGQPPALPSIDSIVAQMRPGQWYHVKTHNTLADVFPPEHEDWGVIGPNTALSAWSGGAINEKEFLIWGGGHSDYGGNEVYLFNFEKLRWQRATEPSRYKKDTLNQCLNKTDKPTLTCITLDGSPTSAHSYDAIQYLPQLKKFWLGPGATYKNGIDINDSYLFDINTLRWQKQIRLPIRGYLSSAIEPSVGALLIANGSYLLAYSPVSQQVLFRTPNGPDYGGASPAAYDPEQQLFVQLIKSSVISYDLSTINWQKTINSTELIQSTIKQKHTKLTIKKDGIWQPFILGQQLLSHEPPSFHYFGIDYDPEQQVFALWDGHRNVILLDPINWRLIELPNYQQTETPSALKKNYRRKDQGIFGRWRYSKKWRSFIGFNDSKEGLWLYRLPNI